MNKKLLVVIALLLMTVMSLSSCKLINNVVGFVGGIFNPKVELTDAPLEAEKIIDFANGANPDVLFESDGWSNGDVFNVVWKQHNVYYGDGIMRLGIRAEKATAWINDAEVEYNYTAGEARTQNYYHYGDYEVSMKPSANPGTASTFFTCTGPYDTKFVLDENGEYVLDENGQRLTVANPHDEIDIEFLGQDTTHVQFNFFVDGKGGNEYMHDLGFDASEDFHTYGYRWTEDSITWFVDGVPVYKVTTDTSVKEAGNVRIVEKIPQTPGRILTNYWCGNKNAIGWMGLYSGNTVDQGTEYQWMATSAKGAPLNPPEKPDTEGAELDWSKVEAIAPTFQSTEVYTVVNEGTKSNVTYSAVGGASYLNVEMDITEAAEAKNYVHLKVTNNGDAPSKIRVNVNNGANSAINLSATQDGVEVKTDLEWGGSYFEIAAGQTAELVVKFGGVAAKLQLMIDSATYGDTGTYAGDLTFDEIKFAAVGEVNVPEQPEQPGEPDEPGEAPATGDTTALIDGVEVNFGGNTEVYGINANDADNTVNVKYNKVKTNTYLNVNAAVAAVAANKSDVSVKIRNNGIETVYITVKLEAAGAAALMEGKMEIPAGEERTYTGSFNGVAEMLFFFIDTGWSQETTTHAGDITITEIHFSGEQGEGPVDPPVVNPPVVDDGLQLNFWTSSNDYTANGNNIKYNGAGNSYSCAGSSDIVSHATGKNTFTVTITNNGTATSRVRIDIQGENQVGNHAVINTAATGGDVWTDFDWGGSTVTVAAGESVTLVITYDENTERGAVANLVVFVDSGRGDSETYSSDITLSGMAFSKVEPPHVNTLVVGETNKIVVDETATAVNGYYNAVVPFIVTEAGTYSFTAADALCTIFDGAFNFVKYSSAELQAGTYYIFVGFYTPETYGETNVVVTYTAIEAPHEHNFVEGKCECGESDPDYVPAHVHSFENGKCTDAECGAYAEGYPVKTPEANANFINFSNWYEFAKETYADGDTFKYNDIFTFIYGKNSRVDTSSKTWDDFSGTLRFSFGGKTNSGVPTKNALQITADGAYTLKIWYVAGGDGRYFELRGSDGSAIATTTSETSKNGQYYAELQIAEAGVYYLTIPADNNYIFALELASAAPAHEHSYENGWCACGEINPAIGGEYLSFTGNDCYTLSATSEEYVNVLNVKYTACQTNTYQNVNTWIQDKAAGKTTLTLYLRNNGTETVSITVKLENGAGANKETKVVLAAGAHQAVSLEYDFAPDLLYLFIDTGWAESTTTHAGDVTVAGIGFSGEPVPETQISYTDLYVEFKTENAYVLTTTDTYVNSVRVTYTDIAQNSWNNINIWVEDKSADCSVFSFKLTNHGSATVSVWVQMKDAQGTELINQNVDIAAGAEEVVSFKYNGTAQMIFFFVDSTHEADLAQNAGDITISDLKLGKVSE